MDGPGVVGAGPFGRRVDVRRWPSKDPEDYREPARGNRPLMKPPPTKMQLATRAAYSIVPLTLVHGLILGDWITGVVTGVVIAFVLVAPDVWTYYW